MNTEKKILQSDTASRKEENGLGALAACHWSRGMLQLIQQGVNRPGAMRRRLPGLNQKVQTACLTKMTGFGLLERTSFPKVPPHVEYTLTPLGEEYVGLLEGIETLQQRVLLSAPALRSNQTTGRR